MPKGAKLQQHFKFGALSTVWHQPPRADDAARRYYVTDKRGVTQKATFNEYNVGLALDEFNITYVFQMSIDGGRQQAFGIVLDFLLDTVPFPTPLWVHGEHWHIGARRQKDIYQQNLVNDYMRGAVGAPIEIWGGESGSLEMAKIAIRSKGLI